MVCGMSAGMRGDATAMCELLAHRLHGKGASHPVAGAVALAARGHLGLRRPEFAALVGLELSEVQSSEEGEVPFGGLPREIGWVLDDIDGLDLLALADLSRAPRCGARTVACQHAPSCFDA